MSLPFEPEPVDRLYVKHRFVSGNDAALNYSQYTTDKEKAACGARGPLCIVCGQTPDECASRQQFRPNAMGTVDYGNTASRLVPEGQEHIVIEEGPERHALQKD